MGCGFILTEGKVANNIMNGEQNGLLELGSGKNWGFGGAFCWVGEPGKKKRFRNVSSLTWWEMKNLAKGLCIMLKIKEL